MKSIFYIYSQMSSFVMLTIKYSQEKQTQKWKKRHISIDPYNLQSQIPCTLTFKASSVCFGSYVLWIFLVHMRTSTAHQSKPVLFCLFVLFSFL